MGGILENLVNIGTIIGTHHLIGTVKVNSIFQEIDLIVGEKVLIEKKDIRKILTIKDIKRLNDRKLLINFYEINGIDQAKEINGYQIKIRRNLLPEKDSDEFYFTDLLGLQVYDNGTKIGDVLDVLETSAHNILIVIDENEKEILIPIVEEFVKEIDFKSGKINVNLIEGMRE